MKGCIVQRGRKFSICYYIGKDDKGKWVQKWESGFLSREDAASVLEIRTAGVRSYHSDHFSSATVAQFLDYWFQACCIPNLRPNTLRGYEVNIKKHIIPYIGQISLLRLSPKNIQDLYLKLSREGLSSTSIRYVHNNLHKALEFAVRMEAIPRNPASMTIPPKAEDYEADFLSMEQVISLLKRIQDREIYWPVLLAVGLGLRRGEVLGLRWQDVDLQQKILHIHCSAQAYSIDTYSFEKTKSKSSRRTLLMSDCLAQELQRRKEEMHIKQAEFGPCYNSLNLVCFRDSGIPFTANTLQHGFRMALEDCELPQIRFHDLRHTHATLLLRYGIPAKIVSNVLGHSSIQLTMDIYAHVVPEMQEPAAMAMNQLLCQL